jgi:branched-chain amino acid transport system permease protein
MAVTLASVMAALAGVMHALWNLNATPEVFSVDTTINALLMTIIGGVGTLVGPMLGAGVLQLLGYWLNDIFGPRWPLIIGIVYVLLVLFLPYGIVGTWQMRRNDIRAGWERLLQPLRTRPEGPEPPVARKG